MVDARAPKQPHGFALFSLACFYFSPLARAVDKAGEELRTARSQEPYLVISEDVIKMDQEKKTLVNVAA